MEQRDLSLIGLGVITTVVFIILKWIDVIQWDWLVVFSPILIVIGLIIVVMSTVFIFFAGSAIVSLLFMGLYKLIEFIRHRGRK